MVATRKCWIAQPVLTAAVGKAQSTHSSAPYADDHTVHPVRLSASADYLFASDNSVLVLVHSIQHLDFKLASSPSNGINAASAHPLTSNPQASHFYVPMTNVRAGYFHVVYAMTTQVPHVVPLGRVLLRPPSRLKPSSSPL
ncbi:hypothetical protein B0T18DRAFT_133266 [Schizothecium vesticola]|uniref:Uncharacterized protein n=1 Tax=Schizothecium vesticola TaxID=314040 RepID=A0AA40K4G5_9PEZI|nr:hypothetical protein B0T18DRAFT_133266 [Schizothecium vesticola]